MANPFPTIDGDTARLIGIDAGLGTPPEKSKVKYGPEELRFRKQVEKEMAEIVEKHPNAAFDIRE
jgi:hypothetical protein